MEKEDSNIMYSKWLNNELSTEELNAMNAQELQVLKRIIDEVDSWEHPEPKHSYSDLKNRISVKNRKGKIISIYKTVGIAASLLIAIAFGLNTLFSSGLEEFSTASLEIKKIQFPDGTSATLNGNSSITFEKDNWNNSRVVNLNGQASFDVSIPGPFQVNINQGTVEVLGTQFDISTSEKINIIKCFEGKVKIKTNRIDQIIEKGFGVDSENYPYRISQTEPTWTAAYSKFENAKLEEVIEALKLKFGFQFKLENSEILTHRFSGQFSNSQADQALNMVFTPMGIKYSREGLSITIE